MKSEVLTTAILRRLAKVLREKGAKPWPDGSYHFAADEQGWLRPLRPVKRTRR